MKLLLGVSLLLTMNAAFAKAKVTLECVSESGSLKITGKEIIIKQANLAQNEALRKIISEKSGLAGVVPLDKITISEISIKLPQKDMNCVTSGFKLVDCSGATKKAEVSVTGSYQAQFASGTTSFTKYPSRINLASIKTSLSSNGAVVLGNGPITVEMDKLNASVEMDLEIEHQNVPVDLSSSFNTKDCK